MASSPIPRNTMIILLGLACLALAGLAIVELDTAPRLVGEEPLLPRTATGTAAAPREATGPFALPPLQNFAAVVQRPLFSPDRRPPLVAQNAGDWSSFILTGIIITAGTREALIAHGKPPVIAHLGEGQTVEGWTIAAIQPDRVVFRNGTTEHELRLGPDVTAAGAKAGAATPAPVSPPPGLPPAPAQFPVPPTPAAPIPALPPRQAPVRQPPPG